MHGETIVSVGEQNDELRARVHANRGGDEVGDERRGIRLYTRGDRRPAESVAQQTSESTRMLSDAQTKAMRGTSRRCRMRGRGGVR